MSLISSNSTSLRSKATAHHKGFQAPRRQVLTSRANIQALNMQSIYSLSFQAISHVMHIFKLSFLFQIDYYTVLNSPIQPPLTHNKTISKITSFKVHKAGLYTVARAVF